MKVKAEIYDNSIESLNLLIETNIGEYHSLSKDIISNNELQRRRVKSSSSVYNLLKRDLRTGCVIPPIVLALSSNEHFGDDTDPETLIKIIYENIPRLVILDGLQRTYTIRDLVNDLHEQNDPDIEKILAHKIRIEVYMGVNKIGILYRMLTLNTGQTPMSSRHQIEIIYSDYLVTGMEGIKLIREVDDAVPNVPGQYNFRDIVDGFTSYLDRDYLTIDRLDILDNIKSLEKLSREDKHNALFEDFLRAYHSFMNRVQVPNSDWELNQANYKLTGQPFGINVIKIFNRSQVMTGFGSAIGKLLDFKLINGIRDIIDLSEQIKEFNPDEDFTNLILKLDEIRISAKKIGNDQRMFFHFFFRELYDQKSDGFLNIGLSINEGFKQYERKTK